MWQPFLGKEVERQGDAGWQADARRPPAQFTEMMVGIGIRRWREQFARKPEHAFRFVRDHELMHDLLEVSEHFDFGERFRLGRCHACNLCGCDRSRLGSDPDCRIESSPSFLANPEPFGMES